VELDLGALSPQIPKGAGGLAHYMEQHACVLVILTRCAVQRELELWERVDMLTHRNEQLSQRLLAREEETRRLVSAITGRRWHSAQADLARLTQLLPGVHGAQRGLLARLPAPRSCDELCMEMADWTVRDLKRYLTEHGVDHGDCIERAELMQRARDT
jgi:glucose-6-phosphate-specific signal transduction histidine kinase